MYSNINDSINEFRCSMDAVMHNINAIDLSLFADETPIHHLIKAIQCAEDVKEISDELEERNNLLNKLVRKKLRDLSKMDLWRVCSDAKRGGLEISSDELISKAESNGFTLKEMISLSKILSKYE